MAGKHIKFDWAIKRLLRNKANFEILEGFLSELLGFDVRIQEILESEGNQQHADDKSNRVDLLAKDVAGDYILIEVQNEVEEDYFRRMLYGQAKLISERLVKGDPYLKLSKVYSINIVYFPLGVGEDYVYVSDGGFRGMHLGDELRLSDDQKELYRAEQVREIFTQYYIIKVNQFNDVAESSLDEWIYFLKNSEIRPDFKAKGMEKAREVLREDSMSDEEHWAYEAFVKQLSIRQGVYDTAFIKGERKGRRLMQRSVERAKAKAEEEKHRAELEKLRAEHEKQRAEEEKQRAEEEKQRAKEANIRLALKMLKYGEPMADIARETGLSEDEIRGLEP